MNNTKEGAEWREREDLPHHRLHTPSQSIVGRVFEMHILVSAEETEETERQEESESFDWLWRAGVPSVTRCSP